MADSGDFSRSVTKIDRMQHLAAMPLDDAEASWEEYAAVRKIIIIYLQVVGLWDYIVDFAAATRGVPWAEENGTAQNPKVIYKIDEYPRSWGGIPGFSKTSKALNTNIQCLSRILWTWT